MNSLADMCFLCLVHTKSLNSISSEDNDGIQLGEKLKCFLIEHVHFKPELTKYVCMTCFGNINNLYSFRQQCLRNMTTLNDYFRNLTTQTEPYKHFLEDRPENQNNTDAICMKTETKHEIKCEELDIDETDSSYENNIVHKTLEVNIVVKSEPHDNIEDDEPINTLENIELSEEKQDDDDMNESATATARHYTCTLCRKAFGTASGLARHRRIHEDVRPHRCPEPQCGKAFRLACHLTRHRRVHTGEKPYECGECRRRFSQPTHLKIHMRSHTGDRRFGNKSRLRLSVRRKKSRNLQNYNRCRKLGLPFTTFKKETTGEESAALQLLKCEPLPDCSTGEGQASSTCYSNNFDNC